MNYFEELENYISEEKNLLLNHPLYQRIQHIDDLKKFTEGHVYAVWDFMSLLKALQIELTCVQVPWYATANPKTRYLINEIVLAEESDEFIDGNRMSHFEMYQIAMNQIHANTDQIDSFLNLCQHESDIFHAIQLSELDLRIKDFLKFTFEIIRTKELHKIAAVFTFGREDLIPKMFTSILTEIQKNFPDAALKSLIYYFQRHIELDADEHGPLAKLMIEDLAQQDVEKWADMKQVAKEALQKRMLLWDAIADSL